MKIKCSLVVLFVIVSTLFTLPGVAFGVPELPETLTASEQLSFSPLVYLTALLAAVLLCSVVVSIVAYSRLRTQKQLVCNNYACASNPKARLEGTYAFDYSQIETPKELTGIYTGQSDFVMEEAINRLSVKPAHVAKHRKPITSDTAPLPLIKIVPQMRHAQGRSASAATSSAPVWNAATLLPQLDSVLVGTASTDPTRASHAPVIDVPVELEFLLRKIS